MNRQVSEAELKEAIRQLAPGFDRKSFAHELGERCAQKKQKRRPRRSLRRVAIGVAVVVLLAAVSVGVVTGLGYLRDSQPVLVITDVPTTIVPASGTTLSTLPAPLPESAWPYPDYGPLPEEVPSEEVRQLAELVAAHFPALDFEVSTAIEMRASDKTIIRFGLFPGGLEEAFVTGTIFMSDQGLPAVAADGAFAVDIPGAESAGLIEHAWPSGSAPDALQLIATMADGTVVRATSSKKLKSDAELPLDRDGLIEMVTYLIALIADGDLPLPDLSISTSTTVAWAYLPNEIANACGGIANNAFSHVAYGREAEFQSLLVPEAREEGNTAYAAERERFRASGMTADDYSSLRSVVIVQWKQGAYLTDLGYFTETRPPVPEEVDAWLQQDPDGHAAAGVTMWDKTVRWVRLEAQADQTWLMAP